MAIIAAKLCFLLPLLFATATAGSETTNMIHMHYYFHDIRSGANATDFVVASLNGTYGFGTMFVFDGFLTEGPEQSSKLIGRAQGLNVLTSMSDRSLLGMQNQIFSDGEYNGSSFAIFGRSDALTGIADRTIVGGSGKFRMARGYTVAKAAVQTPSYVRAEYNTYIYLYKEE